MNVSIHKLGLQIPGASETGRETGAQTGAQGGARPGPDRPGLAQKACKINSNKHEKYTQKATKYIS